MRRLLAFVILLTLLVVGGTFVSAEGRDVGIDPSSDVKRGQRQSLPVALESAHSLPARRARQLVREVLASMHLTDVLHVVISAVAHERRELC
jgi:hypothetical protein